MALRSHVCCYINDDTHEGCDTLATNALGYYHPDVARVYACKEHVGWLPSQWNHSNDPTYYALIGGFDLMDGTREEVDEAVKKRLQAGLLILPWEVSFDGDDF